MPIYVVTRTNKDLQFEYISLKTLGLHLYDVLSHYIADIKVNVKCNDQGSCVVRPLS